MKNIEAEIEDLKKLIKEATREERIELLRAITAGRNNLTALYEELKALRLQQQGNKPKPPSCRFTILSFPFFAVIYFMLFFGSCCIVTTILQSILLSWLHISHNLSTIHIFCRG
jgi:hypothetical protein